MTEGDAAHPHHHVPAAFPEILKDLNREVMRSQPKDIYQFCATYFFNKLADQRAGLISFAAAKPADELGPLRSVVSAVAAAQHGGDQPMDDAQDPRPTNGSSSSQRHTHSNSGEEDHFHSSALDSDSDRSDDDDHDDDDDDNDSEADDVVAAPPVPPPAYNRGRRTSVSAESMAPTTDANYVKVVIPKSDDVMARLHVALQNNFLFRACDEEQYADVVNAMAEKKVDAGEEVIRQGGVGDFFYVVENGALDVFVTKPSPTPGEPPVTEKVYEYGPGGSFGELALMYNSPRAATVVATAPCTLFALDRVTFRRILMENTSRKRRMYEAFLEEVQLLQSLEPYERHKIADALETVVYNDGEDVVKQGDAGENFYLIESGEARVFKVDEHGVEHEMPGLGRGAYFGELALLNNEPRKATVRASGRLKVATLGKRAFVRLLGPVVNIIRRNANNYASISHAAQS
ncbi:cyclic nucleotide-binding-like protein [Zopfochytrium polystomum]|nr:cyclic nucleotide-binding-like protein [Zopfochytrium polystomum]